MKKKTKEQLNERKVTVSTKPQYIRIDAKNSCDRLQLANTTRQAHLNQNQSKRSPVSSVVLHPSPDKLGLQARCRHHLGCGIAASGGSIRMAQGTDWGHQV